MISHHSKVLARAGAALLAASTLAHAASPAWLKAHDERVRKLVSSMTLAEKVGQMTQPDLGSVKDLSDIQTLFLGSILSGGGSDPKSGNLPADWARLYDECQKHASRTRLAIPLLYGVDAVHGHNNVLGAVVFPHNIGLGCTGDPEIVRKAAEITALEVRATGIQWTFAPCVTVPRDIRWGRTYEGYSEDPALVALLGKAAVLGLQGPDLSSPLSVLGCAKHFIGDGGTSLRTVSGGGLLDQGDTRLSEEVLRAVHLAGYPAAIDAGVGTIMPSYSSWNGVKCSGSRYLLTDLLKKELGFEGFLISDYNAIDQLVPPAPGTPGAESLNAAGQAGTPDYRKCIEIAINAGMDMVMVTDKYRDFTRLLQELVNEGKVPLSRIDDAVTRILRVKFAMGMMDGKTPQVADPALMAKLGSAEHRAAAREAVRRSLVLLKNDDKALPIARNAGRIHVSGRGADDLGMQCGGWTIDWQGGRGAITRGGTTILKALRDASGDPSKVSTGESPGVAGENDVAVVVIGEDPYAEMKGDREELSLTSEDQAAVTRARASGAKVVVVVLSGRPLILGSVAEQADAILAAWLPGTEGQGVADVLFGDAAPSGKLSFSWPRSGDQLPRGHSAKEKSAPLYPFGHGLSY